MARLIRFFLLLVTIGIIVWSFGSVSLRWVSNWRDSVDRPIRLTILHWGEPAEDAIVRRLVERFEKENPKVRITRINAGSGFDSKLKTMLAAGTPPDLFYLSPDNLPLMAEMGLLMPLDERLKEERNRNPAWLDDFYPLIMQAYRYDPATHRTGVGPQWGLPKDFTTAVFYVNLDLFEAAGIDVRTIQTNGWTWDEFAQAARKITDLNRKPEYAGRNIYGGFFALWPATLRNIIWSFGGDFFGSDFRDVTLDEPDAQRALRFIVKLRLEDKTVYNPTGIARDGGSEFVNGNIGCIGPIGRWQVPRYRDITKFRWDVVPVPAETPDKRVSQIFHTSWAISAGTRHPDTAFELMKFLCGYEGQIQQAREGLAIPALRSVAESDDFLNPLGMPTHQAEIFLDAIKYARIQQNPPQNEWNNIIGDRITESISLGQKDVLTNAREIESAWLTELNSPLRRQEWKPMNWTLIGSIGLAGVVTLVMILWWRAKREKLGPLDRAQERAGWAFISPWLVGFIFLTVGPMVLSLLLSFGKWSAMEPLSQAKYVGVANYEQLFTVDPTFYQSLKVTLYYVVLSVPIGQIAALGVALLMNAGVRGISIFRTIYFLPSVLGMVAVSVLWLQIFNNDYGIFNAILRPIASWFGTTPPDWFGKDAARWAIPAFVIMNLWGVGGGMIIYLAGLKGIPASLYEAARIDGAGPARQLWNITLPMLSPLIFYNLVMAIIGSFQVFTQAYMITGAGPGNSTLFYVLSLYRQAFEYHNMGYASAMAWILFVIVLVLTLIVFRGSRNLVYYEGLKN